MTDQIKDFVSLQVKKSNPKPKLTVLEEFKRLRKNEIGRINYKKLENDRPAQRKNKSRKSFSNR